MHTSLRPSKNSPPSPRAPHRLSQRIRSLPRAAAPAPAPAPAPMLTRCLRRPCLLLFLAEPPPLESLCFLRPSKSAVLSPHRVPERIPMIRWPSGQRQWLFSINYARSVTLFTPTFLSYFWQMRWLASAFRRLPHYLRFSSPNSFFFLAIMKWVLFTFSLLTQ